MQRRLTAEGGSDLERPCWCLSRDQGQGLSRKLGPGTAGAGPGAPGRLNETHQKAEHPDGLGTRVSCPDPSRPGSRHQERRASCHLPERTGTSKL